MGDVEFVYDADVSALVSSLSDAGQTGVNAMDAITQASASTGEASAALGENLKDTTEIIEKVGEASDSAVEGIENMQNALKKALEVSGLAAGYEALKKVGEEVEALGGRAAEIKNMSEVLEVTTEQYQAMALAAEAVGVSNQQFARTTERLNILLEHARDGTGSAISGLREMGVTLEQINDPAFKTNDLLGVLRDRLLDTNTAQETHNALLKELGPRGALASQAIKEYDGSLQGLKEVSQTVGKLGDDDIQRLAKMKASWGETTTAVKNFASEILVGLGKAWEAITTTDEATTKYMIDLARASGQSAEQIEALRVRLGDKFEGGLKEEARASWDTAEEKIAAETKVTLVELEAVKHSVALYKEGTKERVEAAKAYAQLAGQYYGAGAQPTLEANAAAIASDEAYQAHKISINQSIFRSDRANIDFRLKGITDIIAADATELAEVRKTSEAELEAVRESALAQIAVKKALFDAGSGDRTPGAQAAGESHFAAQQLAVWNTFYAGKARLVAADGAEQTKIQTQEVTEAAKTATQITKFNAEASKKTEASWMAALKPIGNAFDSMIVGMVRHTETFHQAWTRMELQVLETAIKTGIHEVERWVAKEAAKTAATHAASATRLLTQSTASEAGSKMESEGASKSILVSAKEAAAGVYASVAQIPYVGWILAPAAAAVAFAAVAAFGSGLAFEKGGIVPYDTHAMVHKDEMVLPAGISKGLQTMLGEGGGGSSEQHNYHGDVNVSALDAPSLKRLLRSPGGREAVMGGALRSFMRGAR